MTSSPESSDTDASSLPVSYLEAMDQEPSASGHLELPTAVAPIPSPKPVPTTVPDPKAEKPSTAAPSATPAPGEEIVERRTEDTKTYAGDKPGVFDTKVFSGPVHFKQGPSWKTIDPALETGTDGELHTKATAREVEISKQANAAEMARVELEPGVSVGFSLQDARASTASTEKATATYTNVMEDMDIELEAMNGGLKETIVLRSPKAPDSYVFPLELEGLEPTIENGAVIYRDTKGTIRMRSPKGWMSDANVHPNSGESPTSDGVDYSLVNLKDGGTALKVDLDRTWLDDPEREYPVRVDPSYNTDVDDTFVQRNFPTNDYSASLELKAGTYQLSPLDTGRSYLHFSGLNALANKVINFADFKLWTIQSWVCQNRPLDIYRVTTTWNGSSTNWNNQPGAGSTAIKQASFYGGNENVGCPDAWNVIDLTDAVRNWTNGTWSNRGLMLKAPDENNREQWKKFGSANSSTKPHIWVNWSEAAPNLPTSLSPATGHLSQTAPQLKATYTHPEGDAGVLKFRVYDAGVLKASFDSGTVSSGSQVTWTPPGLYDADFSWQVQAAEGARTSSWTTSKTFRIDGTPPPAPSGLVSPTHTAGIPSPASLVGIYWNSTIDPPPASGIAGYATAFNNSPTTPAGTAVTSVVPYGGWTQSDGTYWFHVRARDNAGNVSPDTAFGPFIIDASAKMLGLEKWWSYKSTDIGPQASASYNAANGNLVVQHVDSTPIQGRGKIGHVLRRTYNSQDNATIDLPGGIGKGWRMDIAEAGDLQAAGLSATGLEVGTNPITNPLNVRMIDRDGTPHVFTQKGIAISVPLLTPGYPLLASLLTPKTPEFAQLSGLCITQTYQAPPGVHMGLWRYVKIGSGDTCGGSMSNSVVAGFVAVRPDRVRYEFSATGRLLSVTDPSGNELRYKYALSDPTVAMGNLEAVYEPSTCTGAVPSTCRGFTFQSHDGDDWWVIDPAGRTTKYIVTAGLLDRVVNPDDSEVDYGYGTCNGNASHLCEVSDPNGGDKTLFSYESTGGETTRRLASWTDRQNTQTTFNNQLPSGYVLADRAGQRTAFLWMDMAGRFAQIAEGSSATNEYWSDTGYAWDTGCRQPTQGPDHNLCSKIARATPFVATAAKDDVRSYVYNPEGRLLVERREGGPDSEDAVTTFGYRTQYFRVSEQVRIADDEIVGDGAVQSDTLRSDEFTMFAASDLIGSLTPRGNDAGSVSADFEKYETTYTVDSASISPWASSAATCGESNSGNVCEMKEPAHAGAASSVTRYTYDGSGQRATMRTPKGGATGEPYEYTYYGTDDEDLSGDTSAAGWLKAITDPEDKFVAFAYDRAGNVARTWDRNATEGTTIGDYTGALGSTPSTRYSQELYAEGSDSGAVGDPWRYVRSSRNQLGDRTEFTVDLNGNQLAVRPPRGVVAGNDSFDVEQTFDDADNVLTTSTPAARAAGVAVERTYDVHGNIETVIGSGQPRSRTKLVYDDLNRLKETRWSRGSHTADSPDACPETSGDGPIPGGHALCDTKTSYDGLDRTISSSDADDQVTTSEYDALGRETRRHVPRDGETVTSHHAWIYDLDSNLTSACSPRELPNPTSACTASSVHAVHTTYDEAGTPEVQKSFREAGDYNEAQLSYDADGNVTGVDDANGHTTTFDFDLLGHREGMHVQRSATETNDTVWQHDSIGNVLLEIRPGGLKTAYSYDDANRLRDTVTGADSPDGTDADAAGLPTADGGSNNRIRQLHDDDGNVVAQYSPRAFEGSISNPDERFMVRTDFDNTSRATKQWVPRYDAGSFDDPTSGASGDQASQCPANTAGSMAGVPDYPAAVGLCMTETLYDGADQIDEIKLPTNGGNRFVKPMWTEDGLLASVEAPSPASEGDRVTTSYLYDGSGRTTKVEEPLSRELTTKYFSDGLVREITDRTPAHVTTFDYDANGNQTKRTDAAGKLWESVYFADDLLKEALEPTEYTDSSHTATRRDKTTYTYDNVGNPAQVFSPSAVLHAANNFNGVPTTFTYTDDNLLKTSVEPVSMDGTSELRSTTYNYDPAGRKTSQDADITGTQPESGPAQDFEYYPSDRLKKQTGRFGETIVSTYDADGNPDEITDSTGGGSTITATHYLDSLTRTVSDGERTTRHAYDAAGKPIALQEREDSSATTLGTTTHAFGDAGLARQTAASRVSGNFTFTHDEAGRPATTTGPSGQVTEHTWNTNDTLSSVALTEGTTTLADFDYEYDNLRRITSQAHDGEPLSALSDTFNYSYYADGRLETFDTSASPIEARWDPDGNRVRWAGVDTSYRADGSIKKVGTGTEPDHAYEPFGGVGSDDEGRAFTYDGFDRTERVEKDDLAATYRYDGLDRRREATIPVEQETETTLLHYLGMTPVLLDELEQGVSTAYTRSPSGSPLAAHQDENVQFLADDGQGNISTMTNTSNTVQCTVRYDPSGNALPVDEEDPNPCNNEDGTTISSLLYRGGRRDADSGTYQWGSRTYDPRTSTYMTPDTYRSGASTQNLSISVDPLTMNRYAYVNGDPINLWDPDGHTCIPWIGIGVRCGRDDNKASQFVRGAADEIVDLAKLAACSRTELWLIDSIRDHCLKTAKGLVDLGEAFVDDPAGTTKELGKAVVNWDACVEEGIAYCLGTYVPDVIIAVATAGTGTVVSKAATTTQRIVAKLARKLDDVAERGLRRSATPDGSSLRRTVTPHAPNTADDLAIAAAARDAAGQQLGRKHATYAGGTKDGRVVVGCSTNPIGCAEDDIARQLGPDAQMTKAFGWRRSPTTGLLEWTEIPVCTRCQGNYGPNRFPSDVQAEPGGAWGRR